MNATLDATGKLLLRVVLGVLVLLHGLNKLTGGIGGIEDMLAGFGLPPVFAYGVFFGEVLGPLLLILGLYARIGAVLIAVNMVVAIALAHSDELFAVTTTGGWELELQGMYLFTAIALALTGPGRLSLNQR